MDIVEADYVIVGAGSAGCVVAERLSATGASVLLLEAGPRDVSPMIHIPAGVVRLLGHPVYDWRYESESEPNIGARKIRLPRGRVLGGTSSINGMNFVRGLPQDFDEWAHSGCVGWSFTDVLPYFKNIEQTEIGDVAIRGRQGPLTVEPYRTILPATERFVEAARQSGFSFFPDLNAATGEGVGYSQMSRRMRFRQSTARTFLAAAKRRNNFKVVSGAHVERVVVENARCTGVVFRVDGRGTRAKAHREVIISAGAIGSPHLLQVSGIGDPSHLQRLGLDVVAENPEVGRNLADHYAVPVSMRARGLVTVNTLRRPPRLWGEALKWALSAKGAFTFGATTATVFSKSRPDVTRPDLQLLFFPGSFDPVRVPELERQPGMRILASLAQPQSRGHLLARSRNIDDPPAIHLNYLSDPKDVSVLIGGIRVARRIMAAPALARHIEFETFPGLEVDTDEEIENVVRSTGSTVHHLAGTCRMGSDLRSVVDPRLRLRGVAAIRIVDASIMPQVTSGNINAPTIMIGAKGAAMILEDNR